jgi:hypothetical protein
VDSVSYSIGVGYRRVQMTQFPAATVPALCLILQMDDSLQVRVAFI